MSMATTLSYRGMDSTTHKLDGDNSNAVTAWYVYAGPMAPITGPLVRIAADGTRHYYHQDILGSAIALTDSTGAVTTRYNYSPFGQTDVTHLMGTEINQPFRFTGREYDAETGMYYYRNRTYSWEMRRFISEDPLRFGAGDVNWYAYVGGNPVNFTDPMGLESYADDGGWSGIGSGAPCDQPPPDEGMICPARDMTFPEKVRLDWEMFKMDYGGNAHKTEIFMDYYEDVVYTVAGGGAVKGSARFFTKGTYLSTGEHFRIGFGRRFGNETFRVGGKCIKKTFGEEHLDLWGGGLL